MKPRTRNLQPSAPLPIADLTTVNMFLRYSAHLLHAAISCCRRLAARLKTSVCGRSSAKITGSNLTRILRQITDTCSTSLIAGVPIPLCTWRHSHTHTQTHTHTHPHHTHTHPPTQTHTHPHTHTHTHTNPLSNFTHCRSHRPLACSRLRVRVLVGRADHPSRGFLPTVMPQSMNEEILTHRPLACEF
jgi:hypothetical protein